MRYVSLTYVGLCFLLLLRISAATRSEPAAAQPYDSEFQPNIPQTWDGDTVQSLELPLADAKRSPVEVSWEYYYRIPVRPIYKSYTVYAPGHEPPGYLDWLKQQKPQVIWGVDSGGSSHRPPLRTETDWIKAGEMVFDAPIAYDADPWGSSVMAIDDMRSPAWFKTVG